MTPEAVGPMLRRLRLRGDLTLERLSALSGISDRAISDIERGVALGPQRRTVLALAHGLELTPDDRAAMVQAARAGRHRRRSGRGPVALRMAGDVPDIPGRMRDLTTITSALCGLADRLAVAERRLDELTAGDWRGSDGG